MEITALVPFFNSRGMFRRSCGHTQTPAFFPSQLVRSAVRQHFVVGEQKKAELMRYDASIKKFVPFSPELSADQVTFSSDRQWMAYVQYPEGTLFRSRIDGSDRLQLTFSPLRVSSPRWSPDGGQLVFTGRTGSEAEKVYLIGREGGTLRVAAPGRKERQGNACWLTNGGPLLYTAWDVSGDNPSLNTIDLANGRVTTLPNSSGLYGATCSPDGKYLAVLSNATHALMLYELESHTLRTLAEFGDYPAWSPDGSYLEFNTLMETNRATSDIGIYRVLIANDKTSQIARLPDFPLTGAWGIWSGSLPDGSPLVLRDTSTRDLYALDLELP